MGIRRLYRNLCYLLRHDVRTVPEDVLKVAKHEKNIIPLLHYLDYLYREEPAGRFGKPAFYSAEETMQKLEAGNESLVRIGDGELWIIFGEIAVFQKANKALACRLREILKTEREEVMVALSPNLWYNNALRGHELSAVWDYDLSGYARLRPLAESLLDPARKYYDACITVPQNIVQLHARWRGLWEGRDVAIVCGDRVFSQFKYNIFDNAKSIEYMYIPTCDAFEEYDDILRRAREIDKAKLVLVIAGPTAKVLVYDLSAEGYRALDVGHLAKSYDYMMRGIPFDKENIARFVAPD